MNKAKPFIKWAGGKGQLLDKLQARLPKELSNGRIKQYIEPFVGGGAMLFQMLQSYHFDKVVIIDVNKELINCYRCIKEDVEKCIERLLTLEQTYFSLTAEERAEFFYKIRDKYNAITLNGHFDYEKTADFIFLNHTCFNGLYRVNRNGKFNVPFGKYKNPTICDRENLVEISKLLQNVEILHGDYSLCKETLDSDTFIYFDPPYRPLLEGQSFVGYAQNGFDDNDQIKLSEFYKLAAAKGAKVMLSNSDPKNTNPNDNFFENHYSDFNIERVFAKRMINCQANKRGDITEILITNY